MASRTKELASPRNHRLARRAKKRGMKNSLRIIVEAKVNGVPVSLALAVAEQESSNGSNVWGHDPSPNGGTVAFGGRVVTKRDYLSYKGKRGPTGRGGMQGVGPYQLTWWEFQDQADRLGGCWIPRYNIQLALKHLKKMIDSYGEFDGVRRYNGQGAAAMRYAHSVQSRQGSWHNWLKGA